MPKSRLLSPTTRGLRDPQSNGSPEDMIVSPPRYAELGGLTRASKVGKSRQGRVKKPGQTEHG